jgi:hypothetical protein
MTSKVVVRDNFIRCPCCNHRIKLVQHKAHGAVYARNWKSVNVQQLIFLQIWRDSKVGDSYVTKRELHKMLLPQIRKARLRAFVNYLNFAARVSELVSAGTNHKGSIIEKIPSVTTTDREPIAGPFYALRMPRVNKVLKRGGNLT